ncbi:MAG: CheY-like chemotaxis protein [Candidatus Latescibacterota bacterium]|jgi:CheY-like chemotaxis protein
MSVHILIIDDEVIVTRVLAQLLALSNYKVTVALSGEEGLKLYRDREIDLVIVDIYMPGINGIEVIQTIKNDSPDTPIIAISGGALIGKEDLLYHAKTIGADYVLEKPIEDQTLVSAIEGALGLSSQQ